MFERQSSSPLLNNYDFKYIEMNLIFGAKVVQFMHTVASACLVVFYLEIHRVINKVIH